MRHFVLKTAGHYCLINLIAIGLSSAGLSHVGIVYYVVSGLLFVMMIDFYRRVFQVKKMAKCAGRHTLRAVERCQFLCYSRVVVYLFSYIVILESLSDGDNTFRTIYLRWDLCMKVGIFLTLLEFYISMRLLRLIRAFKTCERFVIR